MKRWRARLPLFLLLLAGVVLFGSGALDRLSPEYLIAHQQQLHEAIAADPWMARLSFIGLLTLAMCTGIPGTFVIILAGGFAFGVVEGTVYSSIGVTLGSVVFYLASRFAFGSGSRQPPAVVEKLQHGFAHHPISYALFLRFVPLLPFGVVTLCLAWLRCPLWLFIGASWLGGTVSLVFENSIGAGLGEALSRSHELGLGLVLNRGVLLPMAAIALLALIPLLAERVLRKRRPPGTTGREPEAGRSTPIRRPLRRPRL